MNKNFVKMEVLIETDKNDKQSYHFICQHQPIVSIC